MSHSFRHKEFFARQILRGLMAVSKLMAFFILVIGIMLVGSSLKLLPLPLVTRRRCLATWNALLCRFCLWAIRVQVAVRQASLFNEAINDTFDDRVQKDPRSKLQSSSGHLKFTEQTKNHAYLIVANHMGMLDILSINAFFPCLFVTSYELKETPVVGWLTDAGGCLFVERRSRQNIFNEVKNIAEALAQGVSVCIFPEAQSTSGEQVLPFKKSLLVAAAESQVPILPITINYLTIDGRPVTAVNRDYICWYGDQSFLGALWRLLTNWSMHIELIVHKPCFMRTAEERREVTEECYRKVSGAFQSIR